MTSHTELVTVTYRRGHSGECQQWDFDGWQISKPDPDEWPDDIAAYDWRGQPIPPEHVGAKRIGGVYIDLPTDWYGLRFEFVGQHFDDQQGGLAWESQDGCTAEVFGKFADKLKAIADTLLDAELDRRREMARRTGGIWETVSDDAAPRQVTFLTAWKYECGTDWQDEPYSKWELLGRVDLGKVETLIVTGEQV